MIPVNHAFSPDKGSIDIYVSSNGVHTDFVLPVNTPIFNWKDLFSTYDFNNGWQFSSYIAFGWGDKGFYLNTPEWKDLRMKTAVNALFFPSASAMHVTLWPEPRETEHTVMVTLTEAEYLELAKYIFNSFELGSDGEVIKIPHPGYGDNDLFFESPLKFHLLRTCNVWTNRGLKEAGVRTSLWTPYDRPILYQLSKIKSDNH